MVRGNWNKTSRGQDHEIGKNTHVKCEDQAGHHQHIAQGAEEGQQAEGAEEVEEHHGDVDEHQPVHGGVVVGGEFVEDLEMPGGIDPIGGSIGDQ